MMAGQPIDPDKIFFTSDTHFGHKNIIKYCDRPYKSVKEMDAGLIAKWNAKVPEDGVVYHLGDFAFADTDRWWQLTSFLNGDIRFIVGNHDQRSIPHVREAFDWVKNYHEMWIGGRKIVLSHYPFMVWNGAHRGAWMLHGHCHGSLEKSSTTRLDVGVDTHPDLEPYSWAEVEKILGQRKYVVVDGHGTQKNSGWSKS